MPQEISLVHRTAFLTPEQDTRIKQIAFTEGKTVGVIIQHLIASGLLAYEADGKQTIADQMDEAHQLRIEYRKSKIAELVAVVDAEFDARWDKLKAGLKAIRENDVAA